MKVFFQEHSKKIDVFRILLFPNSQTPGRVDHQKSLHCGCITKKMYHLTCTLERWKAAVNSKGLHAQRNGEHKSGKHKAKLNTDLRKYNIQLGGATETKQDGTETCNRRDVSVWDHGYS